MRKLIDRFDEIKRPYRSKSCIDNNNHSEHVKTGLYHQMQSVKTEYYNKLTLEMLENFSIERFSENKELTAKEKFEKEMDELGEKAKQIHEAIVEVEKIYNELLEEKDKILNELIRKSLNNIFKTD